MATILNWLTEYRDWIIIAILFVIAWLIIRSLGRGKEPPQYVSDSYLRDLLTRKGKERRDHD